MLNLKNIYNQHWLLKGTPVLMDEDEFLKAIADVIEVIEKNGLTIAQAQEVLEHTNEVLLFSKVG